MYDFDKIINRRGSNCCKWDEPQEEGVIPLWIADMDFEAAPAIIEALRRRVDHGIFGYERVPESYYQAVIDWFSRRHQWTIERDWILYTIGVVPGISCVLKALTLPGEKVLVQTPVYNCFFSSIANTGCLVEESPLRRQGDTYAIDFDDFERRCADERVTVFLLCNPHNPSGRVWTPDELARMNDICLRHDVRVVADEIHCELVMPGHVFTPMALVDADAVVMNSPSKSFNIAGLTMANIICSDPDRRALIDRAININEVCDVNVFGPVAVKAAYNGAEEWLDALNRYLHDNYKALARYFDQHLPALRVMPLEGTYLVWVDCRGLSTDVDTLCNRLLSEGGVWVNPGTMYGSETGKGFIRINIACPRTQLMEGLLRIRKVIETQER